MNCPRPTGCKIGIEEMRNRNSEMRFDSIEIQIRSTIKQTEELISQTQSFRLRGQLEHFGKLKGELTPNYPS